MAACWGQHQGLASTPWASDGGWGLAASSGQSAPERRRRARALVCGTGTWTPTRCGWCRATTTLAAVAGAGRRRRKLDGRRAARPGSYGSNPLPPADSACQLAAGPNGAFHLDFSDPQWAVTPGQSARCCTTAICLGGGVIAAKPDFAPAENQNGCSPHWGCVRRYKFNSKIRTGCRRPCRQNRWTTWRVRGAQPVPGRRHAARARRDAGRHRRLRHRHRRAAHTFTAAQQRCSSVAMMSRCSSQCRPGRCTCRALGRPST